MDLHHFIPDKIKDCDRKIQAKDERITYLETENAMLYLRLAQMQECLRQSQDMHVAAKHDMDMTYASRMQMMESLRDINRQVKETKIDLARLRDIASTMPALIQETTSWAEIQAVSLFDAMRDRNVNLNDLQDRVSGLEGKLADAEQCLGKEKRRRKHLHNTLVELRGNIRVHCRSRPVLHFDSTSSKHIKSLARTNSHMEEIVHVLDDETVSVKCTRAGHTAPSTKVYEFERVYHQQDSQQDVFEEVQPLLTSLLDGYNVCIMAYGQTGSGKTYSMLGGNYTNLSNSSHQLEVDVSDGLIPRATRELFRLISEKTDSVHTVEVSVVEVYNNDIRDLLASSVGAIKRDIFTADDGSMEIPSLTQRPVDCAAEVIDLVQYGMQHRHEDATFVHAHSSRSHLVVTLTVSSQQAGGDGLQSRTPDVSRSGSPIPDTWQGNTSHRGSPVSFSHGSSVPRSASLSSLASSYTTQSLSGSSTPVPGAARIVKTKLQLVDLAGSECVGMSGVTGTALRETSFINRSLSALADVLAALAENRPHVPYRNSRLTQLLQDSIGGDAKLLVLCCVSPTQRYLTETLQSLGFGYRARQIQRGPIRKKSSQTSSGIGDQSSVSSPSLRRSRLTTPVSVSHLDLHGMSPRASGKRLPRPRSYHGAERR